MIGYCGTGYHGMQYNPPNPTIEHELFEAFVKAGAVSKANSNDLKKSGFMRAARTDKGVHAGGNVISLKLIIEDPDILNKINDNLPPGIRVWGIERVNKAFNCRKLCGSRWYEYLLPTYSLIGPKPGSILYKEIEDSKIELPGVLDEADTLMDQSWAEDTYKTIKTMPNANHLLFCSATIPNEFNKTMERLFPTAQTITTPRLHRLPHTIDFKTIDAALNPYKGSKIKALAQALYAIARDGTEPGYEKRCIVFVNEKKEVAKVVEKLAGQYGHDCVGLTGDDSVEQRLDKISAFINPPRRLEEIEDESSKLHDDTQELQKISIPGSNIVIQSSQQAGQQKRLNSLKIVVTTDLMARGLNFQGVRNVILYDVPKTSIDLVLSLIHI